MKYHKRQVSGKFAKTVWSSPDWRDDMNFYGLLATVLVIVVILVLVGEI